MERIRIEVEGPPREDSIRGRLHELEGFKVAIETSELALNAVRTAQAAVATNKERRAWAAVMALVTVGNALLSNHTWPFH